MNRTISQVVFKKKEGRDEAKNLVFRKKVWYTKNIWIPSTTGNAPPVKQGHILLETGWSTCEGGRQDWRGTSLLTQGGGCRMVAKCLVCFLEKTTSSHICSALWLVEKPLNLCHELISLRVFTTWLIGSFLWVLCAGLSPPGWLLNETESRAYTTQIEAHSWYLHDRTALLLHITLYTGV